MLTPFEKYGFAILGALLFALFIFWASVLNGCTTEPKEAPFIGKWIDTTFLPFAFLVEFKPDKTFTLEQIESGGVTARTQGRWEFRDPLLITRDVTCEEGSPLHLVGCLSEPDTARVLIDGDKWTFRTFTDSAVVTFNFWRVQ